MSKKNESARDRARDIGRATRKMLKGKSKDQAQSYCRGLWLVTVSQHPELKPYREVFMEEALS